MRRALLGLVLAASGCITEEVIPPAVVRKDVDGKPTWVSTRRVKAINEDPHYKERTEAQLRAAVAERPKDSRAWFELGEFFERQQRYREALAAYESMQELVGKVSKERGVAYVGGLYLVAKMHAILGEWREAIESLRGVLKHEPSELREAVATPTFGEAHYLLGAIYFRFEEWGLAREHLRRCERLSGVDDRVRAMLVRCDAELSPVTLQAKARGGKR